MPLINVSGWVKAKLEAKKEKEEHKSIDSVIRSLILEAEKKNERR